MREAGPYPPGSGSTYVTASDPSGIVINAADEDTDEKILAEPDLAEEPDPRDIEREASAGGVAGVSVPLGAGPTYPNEPKKRKKRS